VQLLIDGVDGFSSIRRIIVKALANEAAVTESLSYMRLTPVKDK
jgi:hypothetical protein